MLELFSYGFMRTALLVAVFIGIAAALIGQTVVLRRQANIGDALAHSALAGVALGVVLGFDPTIWSLIATLVAAFALELVRRLFPRYAEVASAIIIAASVGIAGILSNMAGTGKSFSSYLFGSIVAISPSDRNLSIIVSIIVIIINILLYKELFYMNFDLKGARLAGINVNLVDTIVIIMTALTVGIASRIVGTLVISSLLVLPYATAMQLHFNYKKTMISAIIIGVFDTFFGVVFSYELGLAPGGTIVLLAVIILILAAIGNKLYFYFNKQKLLKEKQ